MLQSSRAWSGFFFCLIPGGVVLAQHGSWKLAGGNMAETNAVIIANANEPHYVLWGMQQLSVWPGLDVHHYNHYCMYYVWHASAGLWTQTAKRRKTNSVFSSLQVVAWRSVIPCIIIIIIKISSINHQSWTTAAATIIVIVLLLKIIITTIIIIFVLIGSSSSRSKYQQQQQVTTAGAAASFLQNREFWTCKTVSDKLSKLRISKLE